MSLGSSPLRYSTLVVALMLGACHARSPVAPAVDWKPGPDVSAETAALLLVDKDGMARLVCLPERTHVRPIFPGVVFGRILDVSWQGGPMIAGRAAGSDDADQSSGDELVLLAQQGGPRWLARGVRTARFSPDATALAYEVQPRTGGAGLVPAMSYVLELATGKVTELGALVDPLWEADGKHLRATRTASEGSGAPAVHWTSLRARWDRESGITTIDGPGSAQIPAPVGGAVAWSPVQRSTVGRSHCTVLLSRRGGVTHSIVGRFCMGVADDRGVRWSPDGRWLAFPHPGHVPGQQNPGGFFVDVVGVEGGRYPALSELHARARPEQLAIATAPGSVWFDWSPSGRFLAMQDGASDLRVYDFQARGMASLGKGQRPMWSPGGAYLLILAAQRAPANGIPPSQAAESSAREGYVLPAPAARIDLGLVRDARWLPAQACGR